MQNEKHKSGLKKTASVCKYNNSILKSDYDLKKVGLYFFDGASTDKTVTLLEKAKAENIDKFIALKGIVL